MVDYSSAMERRVRTIEEALVGDPRPGRPPGLVEAQRMQGQDIQELKATVNIIGEKVDALLEERNSEQKVREGERRTLKRIMVALYVTLVLLGIGGASLGTRLLTLLKEFSR